MMHDLQSILFYQCLFLVDIKYGYQAVNKHSDDYHYLAFHLPRIGQVQPNYISQRPKILFFTFNKLISIVFGLILLSQPEFLLFYGITDQDIASLIFYIDDIFRAFKTYQKEYIFLHNHFFLNMTWSQLKLEFFKLKINITKIFILKKEYKIGGKVRLKLDKIEKIFIQPISQIQIAVRVFFGIIKSIHCWVFSFTKLIHPLTFFTKKVKQR